MPMLIDQLVLPRCPHCGVARPVLGICNRVSTSAVIGSRTRVWAVYSCTTCGGAVTAEANNSAEVVAFYPPLPVADAAIPERARACLQQALETRHAAMGCVMLCASAIDAMLKEKGLTKGNLFERIDKAADDHVITKEMARWAHNIRLDANDQRHPDTAAPLPTVEDAKRCVEFALALAEFLFVLPARVTRGLSDSPEAGANKPQTE